MKMLLLSNSTMPGQPYFEWTKSYVKEYLKEEVNKLMFVPFAGVAVSYDDYYRSVREAFKSFGYEVEGIHLTGNMVGSIRLAEGIIIGGGNTFHLTHQLFENDLMEIIANRVKEGVPFIGWSAGSNIACPTIMTTNDMPVVQPGSFRALDLVPFQINPHYTEATIPGHGGESRDQRILEFLEINKSETVVGLPEGTLLEIQGSKIELKGSRNAKIFQYGKKPIEISKDDDIDWLLNL